MGRANVAMKRKEISVAAPMAVEGKGNGGVGEEGKVTDGDGGRSGGRATVALWRRRKCQWWRRWPLRGRAKVALGSREKSAAATVGVQVKGNCGDEEEGNVSGGADGC
ncbi:hypothetical protein MTO96_011822 [Rhipicephalus appendiculatus]